MKTLVVPVGSWTTPCVELCGKCWILTHSSGNLETGKPCRVFELFSLRICRMLISSVMVLISGYCSMTAFHAPSENAEISGALGSWKKLPTNFITLWQKLRTAQSENAEISGAWIKLSTLFITLWQKLSYADSTKHRVINLRPRILCREGDVHFQFS